MIFEVDHATRFRIKEARRYYTVLCNVVSCKIVPVVYADGRHQDKQVYVSQHFADRVIERGFNREFVGKILYYVFQNHMDILATKIDTFVVHKDICILLNTREIESEEGSKAIRTRINTIIPLSGDSFLKSKTGVPTQRIDISLEDLLNFNCVSLRK